MKRVVAGVPRVPDGMVTRAPLLDRIGRTPLTVIRAPSGRGKTVLMAQWAELDPRPGAWITVEADIGERSAFWTTVADALQLPLPDVARGTLQRVLRTIETATVLIIDDAHELRDASVLEDLLAVVRSAPNLSVIVGTRSSSALEAPAHALTLDISVLEPEDLLFTASDIGSLVGDRVSEFGTAEDLLEASGGSPLLLRAILTGASTGVRAELSAQAVVRDHLRALFASHPVDLALFASATSVPDDFDMSAAEVLCGLDRATMTMFLDQLEIGGLVMRRDGDGGVRYRYHPLVREVLREQLRTENPGQYRHASLLASAAAEARSQWIPALRHAVDADDYARASDVILHGGFSLLRSRGAADILERVPTRHVARLPFIAVVLGLAANARGERLRALQLLTVALAASRAGRGRQRVAERVGLALIESSVLRITGRAADSVGAARRMLALMDDAAPGDLEELGDQEASYRHQGALSLFRGGLLEEARIAAERVGISAQSLSGASSDSLAAASLVALIHAARGELADAQAVLTRIDDSGFTLEQRDGYVGSLAHLARSIVALEAGQPDAAAAEVALYRSRPNLEHGGLFTALGAALTLWEDAAELGLHLIDSRESDDRPRARISAEDRRMTSAARVVLHAALGRLGPAHSVLRGLERTDPLATILHSALLLQEQHADQVLQRLSAKSGATGPRLHAAAELLTASASLLRDDAELAESAFRRFLAVHALHGVVTPVLLIPAEHRAALWALAERLGTAPDVVAALRAVPAPLRVTALRISLTPRETEILAQLRETPSVPEIAATLSVSSNTVKTQVRTLYRKLEAANRDEALRAANLHGLFRD